MPRAMSRFPKSPLSARAQRSPAWPDCAGRSCTCRLRTLALRPGGMIITVSPAPTLPACAVPVTTVPAPARLKQRSMGRRKRPSARRGARPAAAASRWARKAGTPAPVLAATSNTGQAASGPSASSAAISPRAAAMRAASTVSHLLSATAPRSRPSKPSRSRCSRVCGMGPSSAAITSSTKSMPVAPASMLWISFSCPGTSMKPSTEPSASGA